MGVEVGKLFLNLRCRCEELGSRWQQRDGERIPVEEGKDFVERFGVSMTKL